MAGQEVVVPALAAERPEELRPDTARVRRLRAGPKRLDFDPKRDFVGWGSGDKWDQSFAYFDRAWGRVLENLAKRFPDGPIDWEPFFARLRERLVSMLT